MKPAVGLSMSAMKKNAIDTIIGRTRSRVPSLKRNSSVKSKNTEQNYHR